MSAIRLFTWILLSTSCAMAETVVLNRYYSPASPDPCFAVLKNGKPAAHVEVRLYKEGAPWESPYWKSATNDAGMACPPSLPQGKFKFTAFSGRRDAEVDIEVGTKNEASKFQMALVLPTRLQSAVDAPIRVWLQQLQGVVEDPSGAVIPKVRIEVWRKSASGEVDVTFITQAQTNEVGHFSCDLGQGAYIAIFEFPGFNLTAFPFEIDRKGWKNLKLTMQIGGTNSPAPALAELPIDN